MNKSYKGKKSLDEPRRMFCFECILGVLGVALKSKTIKILLKTNDWHQPHSLQHIVVSCSIKAHSLSLT